MSVAESRGKEGEVLKRETEGTSKLRIYIPGTHPFLVAIGRESTHTESRVGSIQSLSPSATTYCSSEERGRLSRQDETARFPQTR